MTRRHDYFSVKNLLLNAISTYTPQIGIDESVKRVLRGVGRIG
jgi:hypothetical protein